MDGSVILLAMILNPLAKRRRKRAVCTAASGDAPPSDSREGDANDLELTASTRQEPPLASPPFANQHEEEYKHDRNCTQANEIEEA